MGKSNLFNREVIANKSPRNAFDVSYSTLFSSPAGMLLPAFVRDVKKGDKLKLAVSSLTRTAPLISPAFMSFDEKTDFWFVPYYLLWSDYKSWQIAQTYRHRTTEVANIGKQNFLPFCTYNNIGSFFAAQISAPSAADAFFTPTAISALRYLDLLMYSVPNVDGLYANLKYSSINQKDTGSLDGTKPVDACETYYKALSAYTPVNYFRLAAFQCIYMHAYRNEEYELMDPTYYNVDNVFSNLDFNNAVKTTSAPELVYSTNFNLAVNNLNSSSNLNNRISLNKLFTPRYKNWRKDIFTAAKPTNGFSSVSGIQSDWNTGNVSSGGSALSSLYGTGFYWPNVKDPQMMPTGGDENLSSAMDYNPINASTGDGSYNYNRAAFTFQTADGSPASVVQRLVGEIKAGRTGDDYALTLLYPQNIRNMMAQDAYVRASIYANKDLSSQLKALFGYEDPDPHKPIYLGSYSSNISIDDVTATSDGSSGDSSSILGQLAGKVKQGDQDGNVFSRKFDEDGVVIGVHYVMPRNNYDSYRIDKFNTKISRFDYFNPYFDGLGLQPVLMYERFISAAGLPSSGYFPSSVFGYAPRYYEYKQATNQVHFGFQDKQPDSYWTLSNNAVPATAVTANTPFIYKILPSITDRIFNMNFDGSVVSDPFQHYMYFDATLISDAEVYGTPSL